MDSRLIMPKKYIISIEEKDFYPFDGPKPAFQLVVVRIPYTPSANCPFPHLLKRLAIITSLPSPYLLPILRVREIRGVSVELDYEYVPTALSQSPRVHEAGFLGRVREKLQ